MMQRHAVIGIDEAGRGPLAGPVVVAGVTICDPHIRTRLLSGIRDSKKLSVKKREQWFSLLVSHPAVVYAVALVGARVIDRVNIARAANRAALRVYKRLAAEGRAYALLDGGLSLPRHIPQKTLIRGDERVPLIAAASIIAKVTRDRAMMRMHRKFPDYRFDLHKGYGTKLHKERIRIFGHSVIHRVSFCG